MNSPRFIFSPSWSSAEWSSCQALPAAAVAQTLEPQSQRVRGTCCHPRPPPVHELLHIPALPTPGPSPAVQGGLFAAGRSLELPGSPCRQHCAPAENQGASGQWNQHSSSHTHRQTCCWQRSRSFSSAPGSGREAGTAQPQPKAAPSPIPRGTPLTGAGAPPQPLVPRRQERGCSPRRSGESSRSPRSSCLRQGGVTGGRREWRAQPKAGAELEGCHLQPPLAWEDFLGYVLLQSLPALLCLRHPFTLGSLFPGSRTHSYLCRCHPLSIPFQIPRSAPSAPRTVASSGLCSYLLSSSI